jgi:short-subunit dehydrogenase
MHTSFHGKTAIITGGSSGIGKEMARQMAHQGAIVTIIGRSIERGEAAVRELQKDGLEIQFAACDMTDAPAVQNMVDGFVKEHGRIDYFFNNAGSFLGGELRDTPLEEWQAVATNNIFSVLNGSYSAYQQMLRQGSGHIVNVASAAGLFPLPVIGMYGSTKFQVVALSQTMRVEAKALGVNVSAACPTVVDTALYDSAHFFNFNTEEALKSRKKFQTAPEAARRILRGTARNRAFIHTAFSTHLTWLAYRFVPGFYLFATQKIVGAYRKKLRLEE